MSKPDFTPCAYTMKMQAQKAQSRLEEANKRIEQLERRNAELEKELTRRNIDQQIGTIDRAIYYCVSNSPNGAIHSLGEFREQLRKGGDV